MPYTTTFDHVFTRYAIISACIFALVLLLLLTAVVWRRAGNRRITPHERTEHHGLEGSWVVAVALVTGFLIWTSLSANATEKIQPYASSPVQVTVIGYQWCWRFVYPADHVSVVATCVNGSTGSDLPTLVLPTHRAVTLHVTSQDVIHEFWLPHFDIKTEAFPNHVNLLRLTITRPGSWVGRCSEFCGLYHSDMLFHVRAVPPAQFQRWLAAHRGTESVAAS